MDLRHLRNVMGHFATGVTVITTLDKDANPSGLTANAFTSLSLDPPLALICVDKKAHCYSCFDESKIFAINVLSEKQEEISRRFATKGVEKFNGIKWHRSENGCALIDGAIGHIECRVVRTHDGGDHTIYIGEIVSANTSEGRPLIFFKGQYHRLPLNKS
ncbi:MAG TPA: flavin reductase family protein [Candidatus Binatia bacterium]|nr:flavin reductase family protein [Candidatus Binatia bacterium]